MKNNQPKDSFIIHDLDTLRVFADPTRSQIYEILAQEPQTVNAVAEKLGLASSKLYYHFNLLEKHGLVKVVETRLVGNLVEKIYSVIARDLEIDHDLLRFSENGEYEGIDEVVRALLETTREDINRSLHARYSSLESGEQKVPRKMLINRVQAYLTEEQVRRFEQKLFDLLEEFEQTESQPDHNREGVQLFSLAAFLYPSFYYSPSKDEKPLYRYDQMATTFTQPKNMRSFTVIWFGELISLVGSGLTDFALAVWIFQQTEQATPFAITVLFNALPPILLSPLAGSLADRWNRRWMMILADTGSALVTLSALLIVTFGHLQVWNIYLIALAGGVFTAFQEPAFTASVTMLVPKKDLARASGLSQLSQAIQTLISPALAGVLFVLIGLNGVMTIDFVTFFFAVGALLVIKIPQPLLSSEDRQPRKGQVWNDLVFGWNYLRARSGLLGLTLYSSGVNFLLNFATVLVGPLVLSFASASILGSIQAIMGVGFLGGSLVLSAWGGPKKKIRGIVLSLSLAALGLAFAGMSQSWIALGVGMAILVMPIPVASGASMAISQAKIAPEIQGRVFAIRTVISRAMMPLAYLLAGPLADKFFEPAMQPGGLLSNTFLGHFLGTGPGRGIGLIFVIAALVLLAVNGLVYLHPRIRNVETELPDFVPDTPDEAGASPEGSGSAPLPVNG